MKKINFKQAKYVFPIILLPLLLLSFYLYKDNFPEENITVVEVDGMQEQISEVSDDVKANELKDKLDAFQNAYRDADGYTAISSFESHSENAHEFEDLYSDQEKRKLDSLEFAFQKRLEEQQAQRTNQGYTSNSNFNNDDELLKLFIKENNEAKQEREDKSKEPQIEKDPLDLMKQQFQFIDSLEKARDPEHLAEIRRQEREKRLEEARRRKELNKMTVQKANLPKQGFNTVMPTKRNDFIKAIIDENVKGYAGSRIRIRLLEDINVGDHLIAKGTYLYALISGFSEQRVTLKITSVMYQNKILPINLDVFDMDGMQGLYVPASAFREFSKDLGEQTLQGQDLSSNSEAQQDFLMSSLQKAFTSTSQAVAGAIRKNKAKLKYNTYIFLIDEAELTKENNY